MAASDVPPGGNSMLEAVNKLENMVSLISTSSDLICLCRIITPHRTSNTQYSLDDV